jgi:ATP-dependent Lon protease
MDRIHAYLPGWDIPKMEPTLFTTHFGLVSDFLAEAWTHLRDQTRLPALQDRVLYGSALSGRDTWAVNRTVSGLLKLLYPDAATHIPDEDIAWAVRLAMEVRRRVKEQQKRIGRSEFGKTGFSFEMAGQAVSVETQEGLGSETTGEPRATGIAGTTLLPAGTRPEPARALSGAEVLELVAKGETQDVEFKATYRWDGRDGRDNPHMARMSVRAIASFLNTRGGTLLIGVADDRKISGIDADIKACSTEGRDGVDVFQQMLANEVRQRLGAAIAGQLDVRLLQLDDRWVCAIRVPASPRPVYMSTGRDQDEFFVRSGTTTQSLSIQQANDYIRDHWG